MSFDLVSVPVWRLGQDGHCGRTVKITAPDGSWTIVGELKESHVTIGATFWPDGPPTDWDGRVVLVVGPWKAQVDPRSRAVVEIPREALPEAGETLVLEGQLVLELEESVSRET